MMGVIVFRDRSSKNAWQIAFSRLGVRFSLPAHDIGTYPGWVVEGRRSFASQPLADLDFVLKGDYYVRLSPGNICRWLCETTSCKTRANAIDCEMWANVIAIDHKMQMNAITIECQTRENAIAIDCERQTNSTANDSVRMWNNSECNCNWFQSNAKRERMQSL